MMFFDVIKHKNSETSCVQCSELNRTIINCSEESHDFRWPMIFIQDLI